MCCLPEGAASHRRHKGLLGRGYLHCTFSSRQVISSNCSLHSCDVVVFCSPKDSLTEVHVPLPLIGYLPYKVGYTSATHTTCRSLIFDADSYIHRFGIHKLHQAMEMNLRIPCPPKRVCLRIFSEGHQSDAIIPQCCKCLCDSG